MKANRPGKTASDIFRRHHDYYQNVGAETIKQQAGQVEQVSADYQGRVIFELLQNAFDKAETKVLVRVKEKSLWIANDGKRFTYEKEYDYNDGDSSRADFQSLCSISTSNKNVNNSIGNKGVGFKSVYSIAKKGFVNLYTNGLVVGNTSEATFDISFRLYDSFKNEASLPEEIPSTLKEIIGAKIRKIQKERPDRGVPGFYFPIQLHDVNKDASELLSKGYVTIVEIPFSDYEKDLKPLVEEIQRVHFNFVGLKYPGITATFDCPGSRFSKTTTDVSSCYVVAALNSNVKAIAKRAGLNIDTHQVAILLKPFTSSESGLLYNYLPTKLQSPFQFVDFHADFHTKVDRKSIDFNGAIGEYNTALLRACVELFFATICCWNGIGIHKNLSLTYLDTSKLNIEPNTAFSWQFLQLGHDNTGRFFETARHVLGIWSGHYSNGVAIVSDIAKNYFSEERPVTRHHEFIDLSLKLFDFLARQSGESLSFPSEMRKQFAKALIKADAKIIHTPTGGVSANSQLFYRPSGNAIDIPQILKVRMIDFKIPDETLRKNLNIDEFSDYDEILKYYKQVKYDGVYHKTERITEKEQIAILDSLYAIYKSRRTSFNVASSSHRYSRILPSIDRISTGIAGAHGYFNITTLFLKLKNGRYKPAQLCNKQELDLSILNVNVADVDPFLRFLGVSVSSSYLFVDLRIYESLKKGLKYIPAPIREENSGNLSSALMTSVRIVSPKGELFHPATINDNYHFLDAIHNPAIRPELETLMVRKYENFSSEYCRILFEQIKKCPSGIEKLYPRLFQVFYNSLSKVLIRNGSYYRWASTKDVFYVAKNREDYEKLARSNADILCYSDRYQLPIALQHKIISLAEGPIRHENPRDVTVDIKASLADKMIFALAAVTNSNLSTINFFEDKKRISDIAQTFANIKFIRADQLTREISCDKNDITFENSYDYIPDVPRFIIYLSSTSGNKHIAEALSRIFFNNNIALTSQLEIIFFYKTVMELQGDFPEADMEFYKQNWILEYDKKFYNFSRRVLNGLIKLTGPLDKQWYTYNTSHHSGVLITIDRERKLQVLERRIELAKADFGGIFDGFSLIIDTSETDNKITSLLSRIHISHNSQAEKYVIELESYFQRLGHIYRVNEIEAELQKIWSHGAHANTQNQPTAGPNDNFPGTSRAVTNIYERLQLLREYNTLNFEAQKGSSIKPLLTKKKLIFQGQPLQNNQECETIGISGEEDVLAYYVQDFLKLAPSDRQKAIDQICKFMCNRLANSDTYSKLCDDCKKVIGDDDTLTKCLIPVFYVSLNWRFSFFDLIVYKNGVPTMIEVKTTRSKNNDAFIISLSEIDGARESDNYEFVRVSDDEIIFMGNPIKNVNDKLTYIQGSNFRITPRSYKFEFSRN